MAAQETTILGFTPEAWLKKVFKGMKRAVELEVARLKREGHPLVVWRNGKVVVLQTRRKRAKRTARKRRPAQ